MTVDLAALNLNQLVALDALLRERHVGRAAGRMGVTQSAMSHTLRGLRELLGDPLLVRVGNGMLPTPHADRIEPQLRQGLDALLSVVRGQADFDPSTLERNFVLACHDAVATQFVPRLFARLRTQAPHTRLRVVPPRDTGLSRQLSEGEADVALVPPILDLAGVETRMTSPAEGVVISRRDHPDIGARLTLARFCRIPHAVVSMGDEGPGYVDAMLARIGRSRTVAVRVPYMHAIPAVVAESELLATVAWPGARYFMQRWPLDVWALPLQDTAAPLAICWHQRYAEAPAQRFFRDLVAEAAEEIIGEAGPTLSC